MIDVAQKYKTELAALFLENWGNERLKYWNTIGYNRTLPELPENDWCSRHFVIKNNEKIIGYVSYEMSIRPNSVHTLEAVNFSNKPEDKSVFGIGLFKILKDVFDLHKANKINFCVTVGNPIEPSYDRLIAKFGGRIVGIYKEDARLVDGEMYDLKAYEILRSEYLQNYHNKH